MKMKLILVILISLLTATLAYGEGRYEAEYVPVGEGQRLVINIGPHPELNLGKYGMSVNVKSPKLMSQLGLALFDSLASIPGIQVIAMTPYRVIIVNWPQFDWDSYLRPEINKVLDTVLK